MFLVFFENPLTEVQFHYNLIRITGTLHEDRYTFLIISRSILLGMMFQTKVVEKIKIHILMISNFFFPR